MNPDRFVESLDLLADSTDAVAKLRGLVVDLAVTGKLVPQDETEGSAARLLKMARDERARLEAAGKIKARSAGLRGALEQPFAIHSGWVWARLFDVGHELGQKVPDQQFTYIDVGAIDSAEGRISDRVEQLDPDRAPSRARKVVAPGTVIYSTVRPYLLNVAIVDREFDAEPIASTAFAILHPFKGINNRYLRYWLRSSPFTAYVQAGMKGIAYPAINDDKFYSGVVALPPPAEQERIVAKVDQLMALLDRLEAQQDERETRNATLAQIALTRFADAPTPANLTLLFHKSYTIEPADLRKSILTLAVQGKLVPGTGERRSGTLHSTLDGPSANGVSKGPTLDPGATEILRISAGTSRSDFFVDEDDFKHVSLPLNEIEKHRLLPGDLLACRFNGNLHYVGRFSLYRGDSGRVQVNPDKLIRFRIDTEAETARRRAIELLTAPSKLLVQLFDIGVDGLADARQQWQQWHAGATITDLAQLADHIELHHEAFEAAIEALKDGAARELKRREDRWRPIAMNLGGWVELARKARTSAEDLPRIKDAEKWLKDASADIRNQRFAPIADKAMATWEHLRQQSNVTLGKIELVGQKTTRKVSLDVTVDGVAGAALGVMSQGELHSLALSLFLPRATLTESPFRFVVIDDPVQSMDPARVDGLARALEETAKTRQVIVFTHDERLPEAVRRLQITCRILAVTRRPRSVVEVRASLDPIKANIEDALALVHTTDLPGPVLRRIVPGYCRAALEAAFIDTIRRRMLVAGRTTEEIEVALTRGAKLTPLAALAFFDDREKGGDVMARVNKYGGWAGDAFKQCNEGAHKEFTGDLKQLIRDTEKLAERVIAL